jgi:phage terminase small subunit
MAGTKGHSGGHNKKSIAELKLTGAFRAVRHAGHELTDGSLVQPEPSIVNNFTIDREQTFKRFASLLHEQQLTDDVDSFIVTQLTDTYCAYVGVSEILHTGGIEARVGQKLAVSLQAELGKTLRELLGEFRLTPSTRAQATRTAAASTDDADDPIMNFMGGRPSIVNN